MSSVLAFVFCDPSVCDLDCLWFMVSISFCCVSSTLARFKSSNGFFYWENVLLVQKSEANLTLSTLTQQVLHNDSSYASTFVRLTSGVFLHLLQLNVLCSPGIFVCLIYLLL